MLSCPHKGLEVFQMLLGLSADGEAILVHDGWRFQLKVSIRSTATNYTVNPSFGQIFIVTSLGSRHSLCFCMCIYSFGPSVNQCIAASHRRWVKELSEIKIVRPGENPYNRGGISSPKFHVCVHACVPAHMCTCMGAHVRYLSQCLLILFVETGFFLLVFYSETRHLNV